MGKKVSRPMGELMTSIQLICYSAQVPLLWSEVLIVEGSGKLYIKEYIASGGNSRRNHPLGTLFIVPI